MSDPADLPEPDAIEGAPHPRYAARIFGQQAAEASFLDAFTAGRLHHAWLITGPRGVGKATLAWRIAGFLLTRPMAEPAGLFGAPEPPASLATDPEDPLIRRMRALSEGRLKLIRRGPNDKGDQLETQITVKVVRELKAFFQLSAADGGRRVVIVDPADELNIQAANALLKELEEPPKDCIFLLICHQPNRLLPTIRSRCRSLRLGALGPDDLALALEQAGVAPPEGDTEALAVLSAGAPGEAVRLVTLDGVTLYRQLVALLARAPGFDRPTALKLSEGFGGRQNEPRYDLLLTLIDLLLSRLARAGSLGVPAALADPAEAQLMARLAPSPQAGRVWADLQQALSARARQGKAVNLDPASLILDTLLRIDEAAKLALR